MIAARERQRATACGATGAHCNAEMDGRLTRRHAHSGRGGGPAACSARRSRRPHRPRARPRAAAGPHDRRPRRAAPDLAGARRRGARLPAGLAGRGRGMSRARHGTACDACLASRLPGRAPRRSHRGRPRQPAPARHGAAGAARRDLIAAVAGGAAGRRAALPRAFDAAEARAPSSAPGCVALCRHDPGYPDAARRPRRPSARAVRAGQRRPASAVSRGPVCRGGGCAAAVALRLEMAYELGRGLGAAGVTVVSGLALGIDAAAHRGCLEPAAARSRCSPAAPTCPTRGANRAPLRAHPRERGWCSPSCRRASGAFRWSFPGAQPDHGRAGRDDRRGRGRRAVGVADHRRVRRADSAARSAAVPGRATVALARRAATSCCKDGALVVTSAEDVLDELYGSVGGVRPRPAEPTRRGARADPVRARDPRRGRGGPRHRRRSAPAGLPVREAGRRSRGSSAPGHVRRDGTRRLPAHRARRRALVSCAQPRLRRLKPTPRAALHRRLGLRRRRRHPGRPEGVRALRRARDDGDHRDHRPEHRRGHRASTRSRRRSIVEQVRAVAEDIGVDAVKIGMLGNVGDDRGGRARRSTWSGTRRWCSTR